VDIKGPGNIPGPFLLMVIFPCPHPVCRHPKSVTPTYQKTISFIRRKKIKLVHSLLDNDSLKCVFINNNLLAENVDKSNNST